MKVEQTVSGGSIDANAILLNTSLLGIDGAVDALEAIYHKWENR